MLLEKKLNIDRTNSKHLYIFFIFDYTTKIPMKYKII